jgi:hypothetical protein
VRPEPRNLAVRGAASLAAWWQWRGYRYARELSMAAGTGLVCFEAFELAWLGFQPLEAIFALAGLAVVVLACHAEGTQP